MATAGEDFLRGILGPGDSERAVGTHTAAPATRPPQEPGEQRHSQAETEVEKAAEEARNDEMSRVATDGTVTLESVFGTRGTPPNGGYHFDPEVTAKKITEWEQIRDAIEEDRWKLQNNAEALLPPSADQPASEQVRAAKQSILAAVDHNKKMLEYAQAYIDALRKSNGTYVAHEETTIKDLHKTADNSNALHE
ncbi:hypothetical protein [Amycolatopsis sp. CA-230715]|uniref:hypothetical protein n=1 Tax=Amycolatopsis sp. CA-230715 TaxID=2745196 RepID=UPI001C01A864|nr:hypothetical protein [Amycolatopsis sp. CA-230715]QWF81800.1 hypothetical protein HUW46_05233 [Amycolatopsis sp. CA-230715]